MKKIILIALLSLFSLSSFAQKQELKAPAKAPEVKAPEAKALVLENLRNPQKAMDIAKKEGKLVMYFFTGSTWCPSCVFIDRKLMSDKDFIAYANKNIAFVKMDNNRTAFIDKEYAMEYERLAYKYNLEGFPTIILINPKDNKVKSIVGYNGISATDFIKQLEVFKGAKK